MRRNIPLPQLVYNHLFPNPRPADPSSFSAHVSRNIVPEVRLETTTFYGALDSTEARYPGLNYSYGPHRMRLRRFPWHRRLFRAFDELGLTESEIASLCRWEGTKWARERYEKEEGVIVRDTTGDEIKPWVRPQSPCASASASANPTSMSLLYETPSVLEACPLARSMQTTNPAQSAVSHTETQVDRPIVDAPESTTHTGTYLSYTSPFLMSTTPNTDRSTNTSAVPIDRPEPVAQPEGMLSESEQDEDDNDDNDDDDGELESVGVELNRRLLAAAAARERGADVVVMDEAWEQWLKDAAERGVLGDLSSGLRVGQAFPPLRATVTTIHEAAVPPVRSAGLGS
ncbi:hypothetical protein L228DRAFT_247652 [Xylona heveae TC161]|uniref:Uncharacterized protein n=1 Tax=Xylona heveae (strain CBS 132557 / TC161) TaxID=1328760 RepID=A0A165GCX5_XYLHT|nr:hypothetical protein L228DRAFT_247652 [Xylona heveae TC161]KZF22041.1 hypothetical protein L228DRAFT_247652 [Xylona heveae TC161]